MRETHTFKLIFGLLETINDRPSWFVQSCGAVLLVTLLYLSNLCCVVGCTFYIQININGGFINFILLISASVLLRGNVKANYAIKRTQLFIS